MAYATGIFNSIHLGASLRGLISLLGALLLAACSTGEPETNPGEPGGGEIEVRETPVLVFGATGGTGRRVVTQLLEQGRKVRAFVRDETSAREKLGSRVEYVTGDVRDAATVSPAFDGVKFVISAIGSSGRARDPSNTPEAVDYRGVKLLADQAAAAGVEHFVLVSSMGATIEDHPLNQMFDNILMWKFKGEEALRDSGVPYTIVRPGGLTEEPGGQAEIKIFAEDGGEGSIPRADVARVCVAALTNPAAINKTISITSGEGDPSDEFTAAFEAIPADSTS